MTDTDTNTARHYSYILDLRAESAKVDPVGVIDAFTEALVALHHAVINASARQPVAARVQIHLGMLDDAMEGLVMDVMDRGWHE